MIEFCSFFCSSPQPIICLRAFEPVGSSRRRQPCGRTVGRSAAAAWRETAGAADLIRQQGQLLQLAEVEVSGRGTHLGTEVAWRLRWQPSGAFMEEVEGLQLSCRWGFPGIIPTSTTGARGDGSAVAGGRCWEVDYTGCPIELQLDDHEQMLLTCWLRTGAWLHPAATSALDIHAVNDAGWPEGSGDGGVAAQGSGASDTLRLLVRLKEGKVRTWLGPADCMRMLCLLCLPRCHCTATLRFTQSSSLCSQQ